MPTFENVSYVMGVDPGLDGGITVLRRYPAEDGGPGFRYDIALSTAMPVLDGSKRRYDLRGIINIFKMYPISRATIERVSARPGQGVTSMFNFGYGAGLLEGIMSALDIPYQLVISQTWMKKVLAGLPKDEKAKSSVVYCQRLFPKMDWRKTDRCRVPHDGKTDSCCIAIFTLEN